MTRQDKILLTIGYVNQIYDLCRDLGITPEEAKARAGEEVEIPKWTTDDWTFHEARETLRWLKNQLAS